jgi:hypothetical protein
MAFGKPVKQSSVVRPQQAIPALKFQPDPSFLNEKTCQPESWRLLQVTVFGISMLLWGI